MAGSTQSIEHECCICLANLFSHAPSQQLHGNGGASQYDVGVFRCGHLIHFSCGSQYLEHNCKCPFCRADLSKFPVNERIIFMAPPYGDTPVESASLSKYIDMLSTDSHVQKERAQVLEKRKHALRAQELEMMNTVDALHKEIERAQRTVSVLEGKFQNELSARAEAEQLNALRECAVETRRLLLETQDSHALTLRELNHVTQKMDACRERMQNELISSGGVPYKRLRSEQQ